MANSPLQRTSYHDSSGNPLSGATTDIQSNLDMEEYYRPLEAIHGSGLHGPGVAAGLGVTATLNTQTLNVLPGVAIDVNGRHISLAVSGNAEKGQNADAPGAQPDLTGVTANGASISTAGRGAGDYFVTIQFWEWFHISPTYFYSHNPWIRLLSTLNFVDDGVRIVLAKVTLDANSNIVGLTNDLRHGTDLPVESIHLRKGKTVTPNAAVDNVSSGEIRARPQGGIQIKVQDPTDEIHLERDGGNFTNVVIGANQVNVGAVNNPGVVLDGANANVLAQNQVSVGAAKNPGIVLDGPGANIVAGTAGAEGDVLVKDAGNKLTVALNGATGHVIVGAVEKPGQVRMLDNGGNESLRLEGVNGSAVVKRLDPMAGNAIDVGAGLFRIHGWDLVLDGRSGGNKRALVDWNNQLQINFANDYANGVVLNGDLRGKIGDATNAHVLQLHAAGINGNVSDIQTVSFPSSRRVFAYAAIHAIDPYNGFDRDDGLFLEIYRVDGQDYRGGTWWYDGDHLGNDGDDANMRFPMFSGNAQSITFRLRSVNDAEVWAIAVVFSQLSD